MPMADILLNTPNKLQQPNPYSAITWSIKFVSAFSHFLAQDANSWANIDTFQYGAVCGQNRTVASMPQHTHRAQPGTLDIIFSYPHSVKENGNIPCQLHSGTFHQASLLEWPFLFLHCQSNAPIPGNVKESSCTKSSISAQNLLYFTPVFSITLVMRWVSPQRD